MSVLSEWFSGIIMIHGRNGCKITVLSMGEIPDETVSDLIKPCPSMGERINLIKCKNPATASKPSTGDSFK